MVSNKPFHSNTRFLCQAGLIAAVYTSLTLFAGALGLSGGAIQLRISEALCILPIFTPAAIPGLAVGCLLSNLIMGCIWQDVLFGTLATLLGALGGRLLRKFPIFVPLPTLLCNTLIIPLVLVYGYRMEAALPLLMLTVGGGELLSAYLLGLILYFALRRSADQIFR